MFALNCRFQIAAFLVLLIIVVDYVRTPHLKLRSSSYFRMMLAATGVNLFLDLITVYTITHLDVVSADVNRFFHQLFITSVVLMFLFEYLYIRMLAGNQRRMGKKELLLTFVPLVVAFIVVLTGKLYYNVDGQEAYSYGPMANTVYVCGIVYLAMGCWHAFKKSGYITGKQKASVITGYVIWLVLMLIQTFIPQLLLSGLAFVLLILAIYFSHENQKENYDQETDCFNRNAFNKMLAEYYENKKPLFLINLTLENYERLTRIAGREKGIDALKYLQRTLEKNLKRDVYHSRDNVFSIFSRDISRDMERLHSLEQELNNEEYSNFRLNCNLNIMDLRKYTDSWQEVDNLIDFMAERLQYSNCRVCFLNEDIVREKERRDKIDAILDDALENDGFEMYYQPIYNSEKQAFTSAEALIRLKSCGDLGYVSPEEFIPMAEEKGMILEIGDRALELVAEFAKKNELPGSGIEYIEVNLSAIQAVVPKLDKRLKRIIDKYGIPASFINLEITETATVNFGASFEKNTERLRRLGFSFSMDDFGTGYSNLAQMNQMNYDLVKMDKSLIWPAFDEDGEQAEVLLSSVIRLLKSIGARIVAEGVETEEMVNYLIGKKVEYLQGYYYSKPVPGDQFLRFLREQKEK